MRSIVVIASVLALAAATACSLSKSSSRPTSRPSGESTTSVPSSAAANDSDQSTAAPSTAASEDNDELHTPEKGSEERQAIMDALRGDRQVQFQVHHLKVHNGWCWVDVTPLDMNGHATAEGGPNLMRRENGTWRVKDLSRVPEDPDDPLGAEDASPTYIKNVMKTFPGVPRDIFPSYTR